MVTNRERNFNGGPPPPPRDTVRRACPWSLGSQVHRGPPCSPLSSLQGAGVSSCLNCPQPSGPPPLAICQPLTLFRRWYLMGHSIDQTDGLDRNPPHTHTHFYSEGEDAHLLWTTGSHCGGATAGWGLRVSKGARVELNSFRAAPSAAWRLASVPLSPFLFLSLSLCLSSPGCVYWKRTQANRRKQSPRPHRAHSQGETDRQTDGGAWEALGTEGASE